MLPAGIQRWLKALHVIFAGVWLGALVAMVGLQAIASGVPTARSSFGIDLATYWLHETVLLAAFVGTLLTASHGGGASVTSPCRARCCSPRSGCSQSAAAQLVR